MEYYYENRNQLREEIIPISFYERVGFDFYAHWHTDIEIAYVKEGSLKVGINQKTYFLTRGQGVVIESGDIHYYQCTDQESKIMICVFSPDLITIHGVMPIHFCTPVFDDNTWGGQVKEQLLQIGDELNSKKRAYLLHVKGDVLLLAGYFVRNMESVERSESYSLQYESRKVINILRFLEKHVTDNISLEQVAREFKVDKYTLSKTLCGATGMNFRSLVNLQRMQRARELLETTDLTALDIALECGYNNIRTFNRVFREKTGMTPSDFRNQKGGRL